MNHPAQYISLIVSTIVTGFVVGSMVSVFVVLVLHLALLGWFDLHLADLIGTAGVFAIAGVFPIAATMFALWFTLRNADRILANTPTYDAELTPLHLCNQCLYDLRGIESSLCPECGKAITDEQQDVLTRISIEHA